MMLKRILAALMVLAAIQAAQAGVPEGGHPFDVTVLYLVQDGDRGDEDIPRARKAVAQAHELIATEMERHGHGKGRSFNYDEENDFRVHYEEDKGVGFFENTNMTEIHNWAVGWVPQWWARKDNLRDPAHFDRIYLLLIEGARGISDGRTCGVASPLAWEGFPPRHYMHSGFAFVAMRSECANLAGVIAHEVCHAFGLAHTNENAQHLMSHRGGGAGTRLLLAESNWLAGTRYFNRNHKAITVGVGVQLINTEVRKEQGEEHVRLKYDIDAKEGAYMLLLMQHSMMLALVELDVGERTATVEIPRAAINDEAQITWRALSATGAYTWGRHPVELPASINLSVTAAALWGNLKTARQ